MCVYVCVCVSAALAAAVTLFYACLRDLVIKVKTNYGMCELQENYLLYFLSVYHADLLYENFQP